MQYFKLSFSYRFLDLPIAFLYPVLARVFLSLDKFSLAVWI